MNDNNERQQTDYRETQPKANLQWKIKSWVSTFHDAKQT